MLGLSSTKRAALDSEAHARRLSHHTETTYTSPPPFALHLPGLSPHCNGRLELGQESREASHTPRTRLGSLQMRIQSQPKKKKVGIASKTQPNFAVRTADCVVPSQ